MASKPIQVLSACVRWVGPRVWWGRADWSVVMGLWAGQWAGPRQAGGPTCYRGRSTDHRISLDH